MFPVENTFRVKQWHCDLIFFVYASRDGMVVRLFDSALPRFDRGCGVNASMHQSEPNLSENVLDKCVEMFGRSNWWGERYPKVRGRERTRSPYLFISCILKYIFVVAIFANNGFESVSAWYAGIIFCG